MYNVNIITTFMTCSAPTKFLFEHIVFMHDVCKKTYEICDFQGFSQIHWNKQVHLKQIGISWKKGHCFTVTY